MVLDSTTLFFIDILIMLLVGASFGVAWLENRRQMALLWMVAAALVSAGGLTCRLIPVAGPAIVLSNGFLGAGYICIWMACRCLGGRPPTPWLLGAPMALWLGLAAIPGFLDDVSLRLFVANLVSVLTFSLSGREVLRLDTDSRYPRLWLAGLLLILAAEDLVWAVFNLVSPPVRGTPFMSIRGFSTINLTTLVFTLLMAFAMIALVRGQSEQAHRRAALIDSLTGLGNRRGLEGALAEAAALGRRRRIPIGLIMVDVDIFKYYNDLYGHLKGDACLRRVAQALQGGIAGPDEAVFRYGGEEFLVVLPGYDQARAVALAERLRLAVRALRLLHGGREGGVVTISLGVAVMVPSAAGSADATAALAAADRALYQAKRQGRDRVVADEADADTPSVGPRQSGPDAGIRRHKGIA